MAEAHTNEFCAEIVLEKDRAKGWREERQTLRHPR
jgi:hypothetical protein